MEMCELVSAQIDFLLNKYTPEYLHEEYFKNFTLVYEEDGEILGLGSLIISEAEIRGVYVEQKYQNKGIGTKLIRRLEKEAKTRNISKLFVKSYFAPESFYAKLGYSRIDEGGVLRGEIRFKFVNMYKEL